MARPKKIESTAKIVENTKPQVEESPKINTIEHSIIRVMNEEWKIIKIDMNKEPNWATKYRHISGKPFTI